MYKHTKCLDLLVVLAVPAIQTCVEKWKYMDWIMLDFYLSSVSITIFSG